MTRAHPFVLDGRRLIVPLYHDGFSFSLMAISDDWGKTWHTSAPLVGGGNIQPSIVQQRDGSLYTLMRDNGPPPQRLLQSESRDRGETWSPVTDSELLNPGSGAEIIGLRNGHWAVINNDTEEGRHQLAGQISDDEGRTWKWKGYLEGDAAGPEAGSYHYPSIIQSKDLPDLSEVHVSGHGCRDDIVEVLVVGQTGPSNVEPGCRVAASDRGVTEPDASAVIVRRAAPTHWPAAVAARDESDHPHRSDDKKEPAHRARVAGNADPPELVTRRCGSSHAHVSRS